MRILLDTVFVDEFMDAFVPRCLRSNPFPKWRLDVSAPTTGVTDVGGDVVSCTDEFGLLLPNGQQVWGSYAGRPIDTPGARKVMVLTLRRTAPAVGFDEQEFLGHYRWVQRRKTVTVRYDSIRRLPITSPQAVPSDDDEDESGDDTSGGPTTNGSGGDGREVCAGPLGSPPQ